MESSQENDSASPLASASAPKSGSVIRRFWNFPKSWKEVKSLGWKFILAFVLFYLIRDTILYIIIPYLIYKGVINP